jgi:hypothetical protein
LRREKRFVAGHERKEASQRSQPTVARTDGNLPILFTMVQKGEDFLRCDLLDREFGNRSLALVCDEAEKQPPCISVGNHGMRRSTALLD